MRLTKDEARILAQALYCSKHDIVDNLYLDDKSNANKAIRKLQELEDNLTAFSDDRRRRGRKSRNGMNDTVRRFVFGK
jgi:hypothetical protein